MLRIFDKTESEIEAEKKLNQYRKTSKKDGVIDICPSYALTKDGARVDVSDLPEEQIVRFYRQALKEYIIAKSNNEMDKNDRIKSTYDAFKLTDCLKGRRMVSSDGLKKLLLLLSPDFLNKYDMPLMPFSLSQNDIDCYKKTAKELLTPIIMEKMSKVKLIVKFIEESKGNFGAISEDATFEVIDQMVINEQRRKAYKEANVQEHSFS